MGFRTGEEAWALVLGRSYGLWYWGGGMDFDTGEGDLGLWYWGGGMGSSTGEEI